MKSIPNVVCRSRIFHFRRAVPVDLRSKLRRTELTCTLHTGDVATAKLLSKLLYVTSERLFEQVRHSPMLSEDQLSVLVKDFYATVISQENALRLSVSLPINEEARLARVGYYKSLAEQTKLSLARNQFADAAFVSDAMLRKHNLAGTLKPAEIAQVRQAMLRAGIDLAEHMTARYEGDFNHEPRDKLLKAQLIDIAVRPTAQPQAAQAPAPTGPLFSKLSQPFIDAQIATKAWERQTAAQAEKTLRLFVEINGDLPIDQYSREHAARFKDFIQRLPADYGKAAVYRNMPIDEIIAKHAAAPAEEKHAALTQKTIKRHFSALSTFWTALITEGRLQANIFTGFKFGNSKRANEQRDMWNEGELQVLFATPVWRGCNSARSRSTPGTMIVRDEKFWIPLIAVFSGLRQEEICQLELDDIRHEADIWYVDINNRPPRQLKNRSAVRLVPIHDELIRLGLLIYIKQMRKSGERRVFPQLKPGGADGRLGHGFTKWFTRYRRETNVYRPKLDFHSFRHSATTFLQRAEVPVPIIDELVGHTGTGETARYTKGLGLAKLHSAINKITIGVDLTALYMSATATK